MTLLNHFRLYSSVCLSAAALLSPTVLLQAPTQALPTSDYLLAGRPRGASNSAEGGGIRSECAPSTKSLRALMPNSDPGRTTQERPTFWFYVPFGKTTYSPVGNQGRKITASTAKFSLLDENKRFVVRPTVLALPDQAGIVRFTLPASAKPLEVGKDYQWFLEISCDDSQTLSSGNPRIHGWLGRVPADAKLTQQLKSTAAPAQYKVFQDNQLWFESVTQLANNRSQAPDAWKSLLTQFGLQDFAQKPIAELRPVAPASGQATSGQPASGQPAAGKSPNGSTPTLPSGGGLR